MNQKGQLTYLQKLCPYNNQLQLFCCSPVCNQPASICRDSNCQCISLHNQCSFVDAQSLISSIYNKRKQVPLEVQKVISNVECLYDKLIETLSYDREALLNWRDNFGLNELQYHFINQLNTQNEFSDGAIEITGKYIDILHEHSSQFTFPEWFNIEFEWFSKQWSKKNNEFFQMFESLSKRFKAFNQDTNCLPQRYFSRRFIKSKERKFQSLAKRREWNEIQEWVSEGRRVKDMKELKLYHKGLVQIEKLDILQKLEILRLDGNRIQKIENLGKLKKLKKLSLAQNLIQKIENLEQLEQLAFLNLECNRIRVIENLAILKCLRYVRIGQNPAIKSASKGIVEQSYNTVEQLNKKRVIIYYQV